VTPRPHHTERSTLAACIAHVAGASAGDVPLDRDEQRAWLAERGLGLVPVADAATFSWAGPWIALRPARDGSGAPALAEVLNLRSARRDRRAKPSPPWGLAALSYL
jgi:hypothetical protein